MNEQVVTSTAAAEAVLRTRYLRRDSNGKVMETPSALFWRVANAVASAETHFGGSPATVARRAADYYELMAGGTFLPNSPTLMNAGRDKGILSACFVLPVEDSIEDIFTSVKHAALIQKAGGGTGFSFSLLRPKGDMVASSGGTTSGPLAFMKVFSEATSAIQQGAFRRGANMGVLRVDHPDIIDFLNAKCDRQQLTNFNLSVALTDKFMREVIESPDEAHQVSNPRLGGWSCLKRGDQGRWTVKEVFDLIVKRAWESGEPGILFIDRINQANPTPYCGDFEATNPCGEQPLLPYESCTLGSINLSKFIVTTPNGPQFDQAGFARVIPIAIQFLDNVIEASHYPIPQCAQMAKVNRKIGLGVMGFADLLYILNLPYHSHQALALADQIMAALAETAQNASRQLAEARGKFPGWNLSIAGTVGVPMRNASLTTIAPTGSISIIAGCSGGIEPLFSVVYERNVLDGQRILEVHQQFERIAKQRGFYSDSLIRKILANGSVQGLAEVPLDVQKVFVTAHDISPEDHVRMQAAFQKHCDAAVSKTVNLGHNATTDDVRRVFLLANELGCKGVTVYRNGCRSNQPMALVSGNKSTANNNGSPAIARPIALPDVMPAVRVNQATPFGNMHIKIVTDAKSGLEREVFAQLGKGGDLANSDLEAICRLISLFLRVNGSIDDVIGQLKGIGSIISIPTKEGRICSLADGLARGLEKYQHEGTALAAHTLGGGGRQESQPAATPDHGADAAGINRANLALFKLKCSCGGDLVFTEGCTKCPACGHAEC